MSFSETNTEINLSSKSLDIVTQLSLKENLKYVDTVKTLVEDISALSDVKKVLSAVVRSLESLVPFFNVAYVISDTEGQVYSNNLYIYSVGVIGRTYSHVLKSDFKKYLQGLPDSVPNKKQFIKQLQSHFYCRFEKGILSHDHGVFPNKKLVIPFSIELPGQPKSEKVVALIHLSRTSKNAIFSDQKKNILVDLVKTAAIGYGRVLKSIHNEVLRTGNLVEYMPEGIIVYNEKKSVLNFNPALQKIVDFDDQSDPKKIGFNEFIFLLSQKNKWLADDINSASKMKEECIHEAAKVGDKYFEVRHICFKRLTSIKKEASQGGAILFHDITERIEARQSLLKAKKIAEMASKAKSDFLTNMSHELRTPLNAILGFSEIIQEELMSKSEILCSNYASTINKAGIHLLNLINDILDLSKIEAGKMNLAPIKTNLIDLISDVKIYVGVLDKVNDNNFEVVHKHKVDIKNILVDGQRLKQCLINLLGNAFKFTKKGKVILEIDCKTVESTEYLVFKVIDSGIGMDPSQLTKIFNQFEQADLSTTKKFGGTGLGLTITKHFANLMDGRLSVQSKLGEGSAFTFEFPLIKMANDDESIELEKTDQDHLSTDVVRILLVDDDELVHDIVRRNLKNNRVEIRFFSIAKEALKQMSSFQPNIIITDLTMPDINGIEFIEKLKKQGHLRKDTKLIISTGQYLTDEVLERITGLDAVIFDKNKLVTKNFLNDLGKITPLEFSEPVKKNILLVDDNTVNLDLLKIRLEKKGFNISLAYNGKDAISMVQKNTPDIILMDLMMPIMNGWETTKALKSEKFSANTPIIALTADAMEGTAEKCLKSGFCAHVSKPIDFKELVRVIDVNLIKENRPVI